MLRIKDPGQHQLQQELGRKILVCVGDAENDETMLDGLLEKLTELQSGYKEKSFAYCRLQEIIDEIEGG